MESHLALISIAAVTVLSGGAAAIITLTVDVRSRPGIQSLVEGLMRIAILGAGALVALTVGEGSYGYSVSRCLRGGRLRALAAVYTGLAPRSGRKHCGGICPLDGLGLTPTRLARLPSAPS
jgi:hypothetical protein